MHCCPFEGRHLIIVTHVSIPMFPVTETWILSLVFEKKWKLNFVTCFWKKKLEIEFCHLFLERKLKIEFCRLFSCFWKMSLFFRYEQPDVALHCGTMLRECARHEALTRIVLNSDIFYNFFKYVEVSTFDIASDAFSTFKVLISISINRLFEPIYWMYEPLISIQYLWKYYVKTPVCLKINIFHFFHFTAQQSWLIHRSPLNFL